MWNKRKEEEYPPKAGPAPAAPASQIKENPPCRRIQSQPSCLRLPRTCHHRKVGDDKGQIFSREDLTIDGEIEGSVELHEHRLTVGPNGKLQAGVKAREVVVLGTIHGNVEASDKIDIRKDAKLVGDIKTARIVIEDGAYFKGSIDIARPETTKPGCFARRKAHAVPPPTPAGAAAVTAAAGDQIADWPDLMSRERVEHC